MANRGLPAEVLLEQYCGAGEKLRGKIPLNQMDRLVKLLADGSGYAEIDFQFSGGSGLPLQIAGEVAGIFIPHCQRCLEPVNLPFRVQVNLMVVPEEFQSEQLGEGVEPLVVSDLKKPVSLKQIVEDELLLSLPDYPTHLPSECNADLSKFSPEKANPFQALQQLKNK